MRRSPLFREGRHAAIEGKAPSGRVATLVVVLVATEAQQCSQSTADEYARADLQERTREDAGHDASRARTERGANADLARPSQVINGFSGSMIEVFGDAGRARSAVGVVFAPFNWGRRGRGHLRADQLIPPAQADQLVGAVGDLGVGAFDARVATLRTKAATPHWRRKASRDIIDEAYRLCISNVP